MTIENFKTLDSARNGYGLHVKRLSVTSDSLLAAYWLTDRRSSSRGTHDATRHCSRSTLRHNGHRGIVVTL
jgi:hypothetical protein